MIIDNKLNIKIKLLLKEPKKNYYILLNIYKDLIIQYYSSKYSN